MFPGRYGGGMPGGGYLGGNFGGGPGGRFPGGPGGRFPSPLDGMDSDMSDDELAPRFPPGRSRQINPYGPPPGMFGGRPSMGMGMGMSPGMDPYGPGGMRHHSFSLNDFSDDSDDELDGGFNPRPGMFGGLHGPRGSYGPGGPHPMRGRGGRRGGGRRF